ncbi:uncharacterized protein LOC133834174 [Humulus lupulus]|uniref:uncharacterized protein LOC133834174 n=1 Tax=Humulus lupulus TaxID=3486 RepID=UPI002B4044BB|nr:uncharacterized protein LOC133834174 [Humulus lupulus]
MGSIYTSLFSGWCFTNNNAWTDKGRIIIAWNPRVFSLDIKLCTTQLIHCVVQVPNRTGRFLVTFVYGYNVESFREQLWKDLQELASGITKPWMVIGDFNEILSLQDRIGKKSTTKISSNFLQCLQSCQLKDLKFSGCYYTWNNKQRAEEKVYSKIDRALVNSQWIDQFPNSEAVFLPEGIFDHSPILVHISFKIQLEKKPFRYFRMWKEAPGYEGKIQTSWNLPITGTPMFQVVSKLKRLKQVLVTINREGFSDIQQKEFKAGLILKYLQEQLQKDPFNDRLITQEQLAREQFLYCHKAYLSFLAQKAKVVWMVNGDENTHIFHASLKARRIQNRILSIKTETGVWVDSPTDIKKSFLGLLPKLVGDSHGTQENSISVNYEAWTSFKCSSYSDSHKRFFNSGG